MSPKKTQQKNGEDPTRNPDASQRFVDGVLQALQAKEFVVLCGAGISRSSGLPVVPELIGSVLQRLQATDEESQAIIDSGLPFEAFVETLHAFSDIDSLLAIFEAGTPGPTHLLLAALAKAGYLRTICTTNFDSLIEQALEQFGLRRDLDFEVLYRDRDLGRMSQQDGKIQVVKVHGSIDDKAGMAITLKQVASQLMTENRRTVIDTIFGGGSHSRVLILGYSCSDVFDLSPQIESVSTAHRHVVLIDHANSGWEVRALAEREKKNPFRNFPGAEWVLCNTDEFLGRLKSRGGLETPAAKAAAVSRGWQANIDQWFTAADEKNRGLAGPACLGAIFYEISDFQKSLTYYGRALAGARAAGDRQREGIYLGNVANSEQQLGRLADAKRSFAQALAIARELGDRPREGMWLSNLGALCTHMRELNQAIEYLEQASAICRELNDVTGACYALGNLGSAFRLGGDARRAISYYEAALDLALKLGDKQAESMMRDNLGQISYSVGQYAQAIEHYKAAISTARDLGDRSIESNTEGQLGKAYTAIADYEEATTHLERAISLAQAIGDRFQEANRVNELGLVYHQKQDFPKAGEFHRRALELARSIGHSGLEATILGNLGNHCFAEGRYRDAIPLYERALAMATQMNDIGLQARWLSNLGLTSDRLDDFPRALEFQERALALASSINDILQVGNCEYNLGATNLASGTIELACGHFARAVEAYSSILGADHELTQKAMASRDQLIPVLPPIFGIERPDGRVFTLELAGGKQAVLVFKSSDTASSIRDLLIEKRMGGPFRIFEVQIPRETFESMMVPEGANPENFLFVYEDDGLFGTIIGSLKNYQPPS